MILPDFNVLLHSFRTDLPNHASYRSWLEGVVNGNMAYGMSPDVLGNMVGLATDPRIFVRPSRLEDAQAFASLLLEQPHCQVIRPGARHWRIFSDLCWKAKTSGSMVRDAWFAALAIESGCEWITTDRDYSRFEGLRWRAPV